MKLPDVLAARATRALPVWMLSVSLWATATTAVAQSQLLNLDMPADGTRYDSYDEFTSGSPDYDKRWPANYGEGHVTLWRDGKFAAYSITVDDNNKPDWPFWQSVADTYGWQITWFVIVHPFVWDVYTDTVGNNTSYYGTLAEWGQMAAAGHDVQLHGTSDMNVLTATEYENEILLTKAALEGATGNDVLSFAYPWGATESEDGLHDYRAVIADHLIAARGVRGGVSPVHLMDFLETNMLGSNALVDGEPGQLFARYNDPRSYLYSGHRGWCISLNHGVSSSQATVLETLDWVKAHEDEFYVASFTEVAKYAQQRESSALSITLVGPEQIEFTVSDAMDDTIFDIPLTVKLRVDETWTAIEATQAGAPVNARLVEHEGVNYALVDAVPDAGVVVVTNGPSAPLAVTATYAAFDGVNINYVTAGPSITATSGYRDATPGGAYYRYTDMDSITSGSQFFDLTNGNTFAGENSPAIYGAAAWRDNARADDTSNSWLTTLKWIDDIWTQPGTDVLQVRLPSDSSVFTPDDAFGALLFDVNAAPAEELAAMRVQAMLGRDEDANFSAEFRYAVVSGGTVYVSSATFDLTTDWTDVELPDATAVQWAAWNPASVEELEFTGGSFSSLVLNDITKAGIVYTMSDTDDASYSLFQLSQVIIDVGSAPQYAWAPIEILAEGELTDPLGGGEGEQHPRGFARSVSNPDYVYAGIDVGGSWYSPDGGVSWIKNRDAGLFAHGFSSLVVDPTDPLKIYAHCYVPASSGADFADALVNQEGVYYSADGGQNWELLISWPSENSHTATYRLWRTMMAPVVGVNATDWYACIDGSGIWKITDPRDGSTPTATQLVSDTNELLYYTATTFTDNGVDYFVYGNSSGLFRREIQANALGAAIDYSVPLITAPNTGYEGGIVSIYINPTDPNEVWAARRWDRPYRSVNALSGSPTWVEMAGQKSTGSAATWSSWFTDDMIMAVTPFDGAGHMTTIDDGGVNRTVPALGFMSTASYVWRLVWDGATPIWRRYGEADGMDADFAKRDALLTYKKAPFGAHAGYGYNPNDASDVAAFGTATFWKTNSGGDQVDGEPGWRQTGYGYTGFAVQLGMNGIYIDDNDPNNMWFPWNDVGIGRTHNAGASFDALGTVPRGTSSSAAVDEFYWSSAGNVVVNPDNSEMAVAIMGYYTGAKLKAALTTDGGASWSVASTDPSHFIGGGSAAGGVYVRIPDGQGGLTPRAFLGCLYNTNAAATSWAKIDAYADRNQTTGYEAPQDGKIYAVFGASTGNGERNPDSPTLYALRADGSNELVRGEPDPTKASGYAWYRLFKWPFNVKSLTGSGLAAVSPANENIVFGAEAIDNGETYVGTQYGQLITRFDFTGQIVANNFPYVQADFMPHQTDIPGVDSDQINMITDLAADPFDDRVVYVTTGAAGLPCVFKVTFETGGSVVIEDLSDDLPLCGMYSITYNPHTNSLLVGGFSGTWERSLD
ncbi:polysaccharide deacetylase family protein [Cerasicoccus maritimus]|uniref:polysaccharide deacetylase family protein n=1 Tax=Cerasicoccus maritimus TaxID=490089 RepID=UPI002852681D|nr:polysaccharide deacetylase family protein [Cerasicoccus maritimus]